MGFGNRVLGIGAFVIIFVTEFFVWQTTLTENVVSFLEPNTNTLALVMQQGEEVDLDKAANRAEKLSENTDDGLETTKEIIGKTEPRKEAIEYGRTKASSKLKDLADRARQAKNSDEDLSESDKKFLRHISE